MPIWTIVILSDVAYLLIGTLLAALVYTHKFFRGDKLSDGLNGGPFFMIVLWPILPIFVVGWVVAQPFKRLFNFLAARM